MGIYGNVYLGSRVLYAICTVYILDVHIYIVWYKASPF